MPNCLPPLNHREYTKLQMFALQLQPFKDLKLFFLAQRHVVGAQGRRGVPIQDLRSLSTTRREHPSRYLESALEPREIRQNKQCMINPKKYSSSSPKNPNRAAARRFVLLDLPRHALLSLSYCSSVSSSLVMSRILRSPCRYLQ